VDGTEELPLAGAHFGAGSCRAWWIVEEEANDQVIALVYEEAAKFVEPEGTVNSVWLCSDEDGCLSAYGNRIVVVFGFRIVVVEGFEVFLKLEGRIKL
jgi:hypothetical protein